MLARDTDTPFSPSGPPPWRTLLLFTLVTHALFFQEVPYDNVMVRLNLTVALAEHGTFTIDRYHENTSDKAFYEGHFYLDKAPGISLLGLPIYYAWRAAYDLTGGALTLNSYRFFARTLLLTLPTALLAMGLFQIVQEWSGRRWLSLLVSLAYVAGTPALPYGTVLYGHQLAAICAFGGWLLLRRETVRAVPGRVFLAGLLLGAAWLAQYPAALLTALLFGGAVVLWGRRDGRLVLALGGGIAVMVLAMGLYNWASFGHPLTMSYVHKFGRHFGEIHATGFFGIALPQAVAAWTLLLSPHKGLFFFAPWLLAALPGAVVLVRRRESRPEALLFVVTVVLYTLMFVSFVDYEAGYSLGPRHLVPILPFLAALVGGVRAERGAREVLIAAVFYSIILLAWGTMTSLHIPHELPNPVYSFFLPLLRAGYCNATVHVFFVASALAGYVLCLLGTFGLTFGLLLRERETVRSAPVGALLAVAALAWLLGLSTVFTPGHPRRELLLGEVFAAKEMDKPTVECFRRTPFREEGMRALFEYGRKRGQPGLMRYGAQQLFETSGQIEPVLQTALVALAAGQERPTLAWLEALGEGDPRLLYARGLILLRADRHEAAGRLLEDPRLESLSAPERRRIAELLE
jgi:hypothetical protein